MARRLLTLQAEPVLLLRSELPVACDRGPSVEEEPVRTELTVQPGIAHDLEHAGVQAHEPDRRALRRGACRALLQHLGVTLKNGRESTVRAKPAVPIEPSWIRAM